MKRYFVSLLFILLATSAALAELPAHCLIVKQTSRHHYAFASRLGNFPIQQTYTQKDLKRLDSTDILLVIIPRDRDFSVMDTQASCGIDPAPQLKVRQVEQADEPRRPGEPFPAATRSLAISTGNFQ